MVSEYEIAEYLYGNPDSTVREIFEAFSHLSFPTLTATDIQTTLKGLKDVNHYVEYEKIKSPLKNKDGTPRKQEVFSYRLSPKGYKVREKYGNFFKTPFALQIKKMYSRSWVPEGKYFVNPLEGEPFV